MTEPIYFEPDRYDLPLPLIRVNPNIDIVPNETTLQGRSIDPLSEQQRLVFQALTQVLSPLEIGFDFSFQHHPQQQFTPDREQTMFQSADACWQTLEYRLSVQCHSQKTLDYQLLAEPLAKSLRSINLQHFKDAIVHFSSFSLRDKAPITSQIADWLIKIDLTPPTVKLRSWARWGDVQAITKLLNLVLAPEGIQVSAVLKSLTLQIFCTLIQPQSATFPAKKIVLDTIAPLLISLTPQGIQGATIHGIKSLPDLVNQLEEPPIWVHWLDLPALGDPKFSPTPIILAGRGDEDALNFILERLLNPDLDRSFEAGGIGISLLYRYHTIHVMSEAPICPIQSQVATIVVKVIRQLKLPGIRGVRVHGRVAGQSISLWTYGVDFDTPQPLLPSQVRVASPKMSAEPQFVTSRTVKKIRLRERLAAYLATTGIWQPQLTMDKSDRLVYRPRFQWQPSLLLLLAGLGLVIAGDLVMKFAFEARHLTAGETTPAQLSFNNPLLEQKLAQYQLRCLQDGVPDVLVVGSSRAMRGINPEVLRRNSIDRGNPNLKVYNFGINGATAQVVDLILRQLLTPAQLPKLVIWADGARAFNSSRIDRTYESITQSDRYRQLALMSGVRTNNSSLFQAQSALQNSYHAIDTAVDLQLAKVSPAYHHRDRLKTWLEARIPTIGNMSDRDNSIGIDPSVNSELNSGKSQDIDFDGFLSLDIQFDPDTYYQKYTKVTGESDGDYQNFQLLGIQDRALHQTIELLNSRRIPLVFVNMPLSDVYLDNFRRQYESSFKQYMQQLMDSHQLTFVDLDGLLNTQYDRFSDPSHLNQLGAIDTSNYLAQNLIQLKELNFTIEPSK